MKKIFLLLPFLWVMACKNDGSTNKIAGEWQAVALQNPQIDAILDEQKKVLDTMTQLPEAPSYGMTGEVKSLDSFKAQAYRELDAMRQYYQQAATETRFTFRKDSVAVLGFPQGDDSARYTLEGDSILVLNERALKGVGDERMVMRIRKLSADSLTLMVPDANTESVLRFRKIK